MGSANGVNPVFPGTVTGGGASPITAGGAVLPAFAMGGSGAPGIYFGSGAPTISAPQGSMYFNTAGATISTRLYINTNGTTGWTGVSTAA